MNSQISDGLFTISHSEMRFIMSDKREDYISWDEYFMGVAYLASMRSKRSEYTGRSVYSKS